MLSPHLARWVFASVSKFVDDQKGVYTLWIEGQEPINYDELNYWAELYISGPTYVEPSSGYFVHDLEVRLALAVKSDYRDSHLPQRLKGHFQSVLTSGPINIYK